MRLIFATVTSNLIFSKILTEEGVRDRLLSFYELRNLDAQELEHYVKTGMPHPERKNKLTIKQNWTGATYLKHRRMGVIYRNQLHAREGGHETTETGAADGT
jgi:hypothetical protein